jgi:hypothetical protein
MSHIYDYLVVNRMVHDDIAGIGQDRIAVGERRQDVGIKLQTVYGRLKEPDNN